MPSSYWTGFVDGMMLTTQFIALAVYGMSLYYQRKEKGGEK